MDIKKITLPGQSARHTSTVGNVKIALSEVRHYSCIQMKTLFAVCLLRNLSLNGKLCVRYRKNAALV